jgi:hypothetical protein
VATSWSSAEFYPPVVTISAEISSAAERALVDVDTRAERDRRQADLNVLERELGQLNAAISRQAASSDATRIGFDNVDRSDLAEAAMKRLPDGDTRAKAMQFDP